MFDLSLLRLGLQGHVLHASTVNPCGTRQRVWDSQLFFKGMFLGLWTKFTLNVSANGVRCVTKTSANLVLFVFDIRF